MPRPTADPSRLPVLRRHLMTGVSRTIPFVTAAGVLLAVGYALGGHDPAGGTAAWYLVTVGEAGMTLVVPVLGGFVAQAVADRPGFAPGFLLAYVLEDPATVGHAGALLGVETGGATPGLLGALAAGLLAGHLARRVDDLPLPDALAPASPILLGPVLAAFAALPVAVVALAVPLALATDAAANAAAAPGWAAVLGALLGAMMAFDLGGPVNKAAYVVAVALLVEGVAEPMAAVMVAGMTPPLGAALAVRARPRHHPDELVEETSRAVARAMLFITEGAIPYAEHRDVQVRVAAVLGSAAAAAASMALGVGLLAPHGGVLVAPLASDPVAFLGCVALGGGVTAGIATAGRAVAGPSVAEVHSE